MKSRALVTHVITRLIAGGAQENTILSCQALLERFDVHLVSGPPEGLEGSLVEDARRRGIRVTILPELVRRVSPLQDFDALRKLTGLFEAERPAIAHTHSSKAGILGRAAAALARVPVVVHTNHGLPFYPEQPWPLRAAWWGLEWLASRRSHAIVCVGEEMRRRSIEARLGPPERFEVIRSGIELERFRDVRGARARLGLPEDVPVAGCVARFASHKGQRFLVDAAPPGVRLLFVGDGEEREAVERRARERGVSAVFTGHVEPDAIPELLASMDVLVHPSLWEGLPRVAVQAQLLGRPVVAFDRDGAREAVADGESGRLVPAGDVGALRRAIEEVLGRPDRGRSMGEAGRRRVEGEYDWRESGKRLIRLYGRLLERRETAVV
jgi:glycosyltransferase involved in cell wall biosynthesis